MGVFRKTEVGANFVLGGRNISEHKEKNSTDNKENKRIPNQESNYTQAVKESDKELKKSQDTDFLPMPIAPLVFLSILFVILSIGLEISFIYCLKNYGQNNIYTWLTYCGLVVSNIVLWDGIWLYFQGILGFSIIIIVLLTGLAFVIA